MGRLSNSLCITQKERGTRIIGLKGVDVTPTGPGWLLVDGWPLNTAITIHDFG